MLFSPLLSDLWREDKQKMFCCYDESVKEMLNCFFAKVGLGCNAID